MNASRSFRICLALGLAYVAAVARAEPIQRFGHPLVLAHYMPWFQSKPFSGSWGWHWTMNHFDPGAAQGAPYPLASRFHPLIGAYDSGDPDALECQCLLIKMSGLDGVVLDWYGLADADDYAENHRHDVAMANAIQKSGLKFAVLFEDWTLNNLIRQGKLTASKADSYGRSCVDWAATHWFNNASYVRLDDRPLFLEFGPQYYKAADLNQIFAGLSPQPDFFSLQSPVGPAIGGFDWPEPQPGDAKSWVQLDNFYQRSKAWKSFIAVAYPRFEDIYAQAGVHQSWGEIRDQDGKTYQTTLRKALDSSAPVVQIATWNDWGEGTQIEPSFEFGYRDLETTQRAIRALKGSSLRYSAADLRLPVKLYELRKRFHGDPKEQRLLDRAAQMMRDGGVAGARRILNSP